MEETGTDRLEGEKSKAGERAIGGERGIVGERLKWERGL